MTRTLLPVFSKYSLGLNIHAKEPAENFSFMADDERYDYETFRSGLDGIPGSREYLKSYEHPEGASFFDSMGTQIMCAAGGHHSGASASLLALQYKALLNDWDGWVKAVKLRQAEDNYSKAQLEDSSTWQFSHATTDEGRSHAIKNLRAEFSLTYSEEEIGVMIEELIQEFDDNYRKKHLMAEEDYFNSGIKVLEHHYKFPERWDDAGKGRLTSSLFGSIHNITDEMFATMEKKHPGYRLHICSIITPHVPRCACGACHKKRVANGTDAEYSAWTHAQSAAIMSRSPRSATLLLAAEKADSAIGDALNMPGGNTHAGFVKNLFQTVQGVNYDDKCPHGLPFYACMSCSH